MLVGVSVLAVVAFFFVTTRGPTDSPDPSGAGGTPTTQAPSIEGLAPAAPLDPVYVAAVESLQAAVDAASDTPTRLERQRALADLYRRIGRQDLAAEVHVAVAESSGNAGDWAQAGNDYYDWMEQSEGAAVVRSAKQAIAAYQRSLEIDPDNLDVRTDMAIAYLNDPDNPMKAIEETGKVLERDPSHPQANFNRGVMLTLIGRYDEAIAQYERVQELTEPGSYIYEEAGERRARLESALGAR